MKASGDSDAVERLGLLASAIARRPVQVAPAKPGEGTWTDGKVIYVDLRASAHERLVSLTVQASLLAAGSLEHGIARALARRPGLTRRYLSLEGHRALAAHDALLPPAVRSLIRFEVAASSHSPAASLSAAKSGGAIPAAPDSFGTISPRRLVASLQRVAAGQGRTHAVRAAQTQPTVELAPDADAAGNTPDPFSSPVGGGGPIGRWLAKLLSPLRQLRGGGSPGADAPAHWTRTGRRGTGRAVLSTAAPATPNDSQREPREAATKYPEWDVFAGSYRPDHCTVHELEAKPNARAARIAMPDRTGLCRALARLGLGIDRYPRQPQGDDVDIDAAIEAWIEQAAGSAPDDDVFIASVRRRRDLSVLLLLDVSGSAADPADDGKTVHEHQRAAAAALTLALHELGDRVALYAYHSQGRSAVNLTPVKRFGEAPSSLVMQRLAGLEPGAYSRLGAAIRHGTAVLQDYGGTPRQLLVVLSDGLAYDHGYEPVYGAADARRALEEARRGGVGCLCLSACAGTDAETLRRVFGSSAHATLPAPDQLCHVIGPLFRSAIRAADVRRRLS